MSKVVALVDCNNFFASCEKIFRPDLKHKPVVVLSNNDGCFIARSKEAKLLGIPMGAPCFQYKDLILKHKVTCFSVNFNLYGHISKRIMSILKDYTPSLLVYSIDEAFLDLTHVSKDKLEYQAKLISQIIPNQVGVPVTVGVAPTKTLAKLISDKAKQDGQAYLSYFSLSNTDLHNLYANTLVHQVWGIGSKITKGLNNYSIYTVQDFLKADESFIRKKFSIITLRTLLELKGVDCISLDTSNSKKSIISSRSFGKPVSDIDTLAQSIAYHVLKASFKLRKQNSEASYLSVYLKTSKYQPIHLDQVYRSKSNACVIPYPTSNPNILIKYAKKLLPSIYQKGVNYKKAGICLSSISPKSHTQTSFIYNTEIQEKNYQLFKTIDNINIKHGKEVITLAATGLKSQIWLPKKNLKSPNYLSSWSEIPIIKS